MMSPAGAVLPAACGAAMMGFLAYAFGVCWVAIESDWITIDVGKSVRTFAADGVVSSAIMKVTIAEVLLDRGLEVSTT